MQSQLLTLRGEFESVLKEAKKFCEDHELEDHDFQERRLRKKKKMPGEVCSDEVEKTLTVDTDEKLLSLQLTQQYRR